VQAAREPVVVAEGGEFDQGTGGAHCGGTKGKDDRVV
jgi:hypothetical protein